MDVRITRPPTGGRVRAIPSKSAAHRVLIAAAMSGIDLGPHCDGLSQDITATKTCLQVLLTAKAGVSLPCGESGSTLRFLIPLAGVLGIDGDFLCQGRLPDRPMEPFLRALADQGCQVTGRNPKALRGRLRGGDFCLPGDISSQYVTGLLMALPLAEEDSRIIVRGVLQSRPYIDLTLEILAKAGIEVREKMEAVSDGPAAIDAGPVEAGDGGPAAKRYEAEGSGPATVFEIPGRQVYRLPQEELEAIEGDWSNAAFWLTMDAMIRRGREGDESREPLEDLSGGGVTGDVGRIVCTGLSPDSSQGDKAIVEVIRRIESADEMAWRRETGDQRDRACAGGAITGPDIRVAARSGFVEIDVSDIPDLVPIIAAFACGRPLGAITHIAKAQRLRMKESDRLRSVTEVLTGLGADITEEPAGLLIRGSRTLPGGEVDSFGDHRIVMMAAAAACISRGEVLIRNAQAVNKSYPAFFDDYRMLGGEVEIL